jgi:hypothetical protein
VLRLRGSGVTGEGVEEIKAALPRCRVIR